MAAKVVARFAFIIAMIMTMVVAMIMVAVRTMHVLMLDFFFRSCTHFSDM